MIPDRRNQSRYTMGAAEPEKVGQEFPRRRATDTLEAQIASLRAEIECLKASDDRSSAHDLTSAAEAARLDQRLRNLETIPALVRSSAEETQQLAAMRSRSAKVRENVKLFASFVGTIFVAWLASRGH